ncbi:MFS transporter [Acetobacter nitrogenifigens]|uniref:MFS transporter n=1 Tax=Acetobacter nitrogenifigens DSM 23921 = NBRC 105050 TaxID=1120919 RepID=A0A511X980_9PROT|nr:MFS transporter [Acetobacter nitrogenifigens]GEN59507.1 MFS transporter [Acetobacter nitrogenifigens DSM 23921 = NBRC 105050]
MSGKIDIKPLLGLLGVLIAALSAEFNDQVVGVVMPDLRGALGVGHDPGTWLESLYVSGEVLGMCFSPWWMYTLSLRKLVLIVLSVNCLTSVCIPQCENLTLLFSLRWIQGLSGGLTIPLLMATALRALPPPIRLWGLAVYALTATFTPNLSVTLAALWSDVVGWQFGFYESIFLCSIAAALCSTFLWRDPTHFERLRQFDWRGSLLAFICLSSLSTFLIQGDRLDWFNSPLICVLILLTVVSFPLFVINENRHPLPLVKLPLLKRPNLLYGVIALFTLLLINAASSSLPVMYLTEVQGYRPINAHLITLEIGLTQLVFLPSMAVLLNRERVDPRVVSFIGVSLFFCACIGESFVTSSWNREQFYGWQLVFSLALAMIVVPLLQMATNSIQPPEGAFAAGIVNTPRAISEAVGLWLLDLIERWRGGLHSSRVTDQLGRRRFEVVQSNGYLPQHPTPLLPDGAPRFDGSLEWFSHTVKAEVTTLTVSDAYLVFAAISVGLMLLIVTLPIRTYAPRIALMKK